VKDPVKQVSTLIMTPGIVRNVWLIAINAIKSIML